MKIRGSGWEDCGRQRKDVLLRPSQMRKCASRSRAYDTSVDTMCAIHIVTMDVNSDWQKWGQRRKERERKAFESALEGAPPCSSSFYANNAAWIRARRERQREGGWPEPEQSPPMWLTFWIFLFLFFFSAVILTKGTAGEYISKSPSRMHCALL